MLAQNEKKILNLIKLAPTFIILVSVITIYIIIDSNNKNLDSFIKKIEQELIEKKKLLVKREVERVHSYINNETKRVKLEIKLDIKKRVNEAYSIINSIYQNNKEKDEKVIKKLIFDALREIRFNKNRGYYFIYTIDGINKMHPILPKLEGKSLWNFKDKKGLFISREFKKIAINHNEGFLTWWWTKPKDIKTEYEKIGFIKVFKPFNWYVGTGEYIYDYEEVLKKEILQRVRDIRFGENGYIFIIDKNGKMISHINSAMIGLDLKSENKNWVKTSKKAIEVGKKGEGYLTYLNKEPNTGELITKISFIKGFSHWGWSIGSGVYIDDLNSEFLEKKSELIKRNEEQLNKIIIVSILLFTFFISLSLYFSKNIKNRFLNYREKVAKKTSELILFNNNLEKKVKERTQELELTNKKLKSTIEDLSQTKEDLLLSQKMATLGELVSAITHELNTPLGIGITSISHISELTSKTKKLYQNEEMTENDFTSYLEDLTELSKIISINLNNTAKLVKSFKDVAVDQAIEEKREFNIKNYMDEILLALKSKIKKSNVQINVICDDKISLNTYPNYIFQIFTNLINNSILHGFSKDENGLINIEIIEENEIIKIIYKDDGKGIPEDLSNNIFDEYFTTKKGQGGTGLGLFIIKKILNEKLQGDIKLSTSYTKGVKFLINIQKNI